LHAVMLGDGFIAGFHVEQREVGVHELFLRLESLGFVPFGNGGRVISLAIPGHPEGKLRLEMIGVRDQQFLQLRDGRIIVGLAEVENPGFGSGYPM